MILLDSNLLRELDFEEVAFAIFDFNHSKILLTSW
jgi:hypothetical protein